jgi:hypothetical protein
MALIVAGVLLINASPGLAGTVNVSFIDPENLTDASLQGGYGMRAEQGTLDEIGRFFESLGSRYLKSGQVLTLDVLNVDLAGRIEWWRRNFYDTRILRDVYPPRFKLNYQLAEAGGFWSRARRRWSTQITWPIRGSTFIQATHCVLKRQCWRIGSAGGLTSNAPPQAFDVRP